MPANPGKALRDGRLIPDIGIVPRRGGAEEFLDINDVVLEAIARLPDELRSHRIVVALSLEGGLPPIEGNNAQLQQAFVYLIENAIEAMAGVALRARRLRISTERRGQVIIVRVKDRGRGIATTDYDGIFDPLYTTKPKRVGLGLPICRSIIAAHGGRVWAKPGETGGAVLEVALPAARGRGGPKRDPCASA